MVDRIAAVVNDDVIVLTEVYDLGADYIERRCPGRSARCAHEAEMEVLDSLIMGALINQELVRLEMDVAAEEVDQQIEFIMRENNMADREELRAEVERSGLTWSTFRDQLTEQLRTQRFQQAVIGPRITVPDDEVKDYYQRTVRDYVAPMEVELDAAGFLLEAEMAEEVLAETLVSLSERVARINAGEESWESARDEIDTAGVSVAFLGHKYRQGQLAEAIEKVAFQIEPGTVAAPILAGGVVYLVRVLQRGAGASDLMEYEEAEAGIRQQLFELKIEEAREEWYQVARRQAHVEIMLRAPE